eukprot:7223544-Pyramimonas_sp.AAC.1
MKSIAAYFSTNRSTRSFTSSIAAFAAVLESRYQTKPTTSIRDAHHQCWMHFGRVRVVDSDGEGALNHDAAKAVSKAKGAEL